MGSGKGRGMIDVLLGPLRKLSQIRRLKAMGNVLSHSSQGQKSEIKVGYQQGHALSPGPGGGWQFPASLGL